jgi:putative tricarboxylic transport membrane protein
MTAESDTTNATSSRPVVATRSVDIAVSLLLLGLACLLGWDSWRTGMSWAEDGPQAGYFPFYLSVLMGAASLYGLVTVSLARAAERGAFVLRDQFGRVLQVFVPTLLFCIATQFLGLYVASFVLIAGFMWWIGNIRIWVSLLTSFMFTAAMFITFEIAFDVIMPKGPLEAAFGY